MRHIGRGSCSLPFRGSMPRCKERAINRKQPTGKEKPHTSSNPVPSSGEFRANLHFSIRAPKICQARRRGARRASQPISVIGYLSSGSPRSDEIPARLIAFRQGLNETGYVEGKNVAIEYGWAQGQYNRFPALTDDLLRHQVSVIVTPGPSQARYGRRQRCPGYDRLLKRPDRARSRERSNHMARTSAPSPASR